MEGSCDTRWPLSLWFIQLSNFDSNVGTPSTVDQSRCWWFPLKLPLFGASGNGAETLCGAPFGGGSPGLEVSHAQLVGSLASASRALEKAAEDSERTRRDQGVPMGLSQNRGMLD